MQQNPTKWRKILNGYDSWLEEDMVGRNCGMKCCDSIKKGVEPPVVTHGGRVSGKWVAMVMRRLLP